LVKIYQFHVNVFAESRETGFAFTWEDAAALLDQLPRMIFEPDGSFVISGGERETLWHVSGHLFDFDGRLHRLELHGECPPEMFDALLRCVGWPTERLVFQLVREGIDVDEVDFRRRAAAQAQ
jgi:hypothetical protein